MCLVSINDYELELSSNVTDAEMKGIACFAVYNRVVIEKVK